MADVTLEIADASGSSRELLLLRDWLLREPDIRGRVRAVDRPADEGHLGPVLDVLLLALGPSGVATAATSAVIAWIKHQRSDLALRITREDGSSFELASKRVKGLDSTDLISLMGQFGRFLEGGSGSPGSETELGMTPASNSKTAGRVDD